MKKITLFLILICQQSFATIITVTNPGNGNDIRANLVTAITAAVDGDTVVIPTCSVTVTPPTISITKKIKLFGTDTSNTILYRSEATSDGSLLNVPIITFDGSAWSLANSGVKVQGIKFRSKQPSAFDNGSDGLSLALDQGLKFINVPFFEVKECSFWYFGNGGTMVYHRDYYARGLIHKSNYYFNAKGLTGLGYGYGVVVYGENEQWIPYVNPSSGNFIFIEDNIFSWHSHAIAAGGCALYVSRYNKIYNNLISANVSKHAIDGHGQQGNGGALGSDNYFSTRLFISYMDTVINDKFFDRTTYVSNGTQPLSKPMERAILTRGGECIIHDVYVRGYRFAVSVSLDGGAWSYPYLFGAGYRSGLTYPSTHTGSSFSHGAGDVFFWNISYALFDGSDGDGTYFWNYKTSDFLVNRDYHSSTNASEIKSNYTDYPYPYPSY